MYKNSMLKMLLITSFSMVVFVASLFLMNAVPHGNNGSENSSYIKVTASETKVTTTNLNLRTGAGTSFSVILVIPKGSLVTVTDYAGVWAKATYNGNTGYCNTNYLTDPSTSPAIRYTTTSLNLRTGPGTNYSIILVIPKGSAVQMISSANGWANITYGGKTGYASAAYLSDTGTTPPTLSYVYTTMASLNLRTGPSTSYPVLLAIPQETLLYPLEASNGWYKVIYGGKAGYVSGSYVSVSDTRATAEAFVNTKGLSSSTQYLIWVNTKTIHTYVFTGETGSWSLVKDMLSTVGKESTPTAKGTFSLLSKGSYFTVPDHDDLICKYYNQFYKDYLIHSVVYNTDGQLVDGRLGMRLSNGCVRVSLENSKYIYYTVPIGSRIYVN